MFLIISPSVLLNYTVLFKLLKDLHDMMEEQLYLYSPQLIFVEIHKH